LVIDGFDELPPPDAAAYVAYLGNILSLYPATRVVTSATPDDFDGLTKLGFVPLALANWDEILRRDFINRWSDQWITHLGPLTNGTEAIDPILLNAWLINDNTLLSPLELTLKVWAIYSGELPGARITDWIEAYLRRMTVEISKGRPALEMLAIQAMLAQRPVFTAREAQAWLVEIEPPPPAELAPTENTPENKPEWPPGFARTAIFG
jgi:hypothetical protein